jgi:hypothetical protein
MVTQNRPRDPREAIAVEVVAIDRETAGLALVGRSRNLSMSGIFVETRESPAVGTELQIYLGLEKVRAGLRAVGRVVHVAPGVGFGAKFLDESLDGRTFMQRFMQRHSAS